MDFTKRTVRSRPGLSQEEALESLQSHPLFHTGTKIASIRRRGDRWVADLLEPKTAEFPPSGGEEDDGGEEEAAPKKPAFEDDGGDPEAESPDDSGPDGEGGPPKPEGEGKEKGKGGEKAEVAQLLHLVQQIADKLGISAEPEMGLGGPDDLGPGAGPEGPPPPHGGPPGMGGPPPHGAPPGGAMGGGRPIKPGEMPNKPGVVPVGAPAFASTTTGTNGSFTIQANPGVGVPVPQAAQGGPMAGPGGGQSSCPHGQDPNSCPQCKMPGAAGPAPAPGIVGRAASFNASAPDPQRRMTIKQAKASLEAEFGPRGYQVKRIRRDGDRIRALLSVR